MIWSLCGRPKPPESGKDLLAQLSLHGRLLSDGLSEVFRGIAVEGIEIQGVGRWKSEYRCRGEGKTRIRQGRRG